MRICSNCGSDKTYMRNDRAKPRPHWHKHNDKWYCQKCAFKLFLTSKYTKRRLTYRGKKITFPYNIRSGICQWCKKKGITFLHHIKYHDDNPLKDTIEICKSCHSKHHWKPRESYPRDPSNGRYIKSIKNYKNRN